MRFLNRAKNRAIREAVNRFNLPASLLRYQYLKSEPPAEYIRRLGTQVDRSLFGIHQIEAEGISCGPLPLNISSREQLSRLTKKGAFEYPFSFYDVPERKVSGARVVTIPDCRIVPCSDQWGHEFYAIVGKDDRLLSIRGTVFRNEHSRILRSQRAERIKRASWVLEIWFNNYFHWLVYNLPKVMLLKNLNLAEHIILPSKEKLHPFVEDSIQSLGLSLSGCARINNSLIRVDELTIIEIDYFPSPLLNQVREAIIGEGQHRPHRRVFISREKAQRRKLENEREIWSIIQAAGFERVAMEELSFTEQVALMKETKVLLATSGAGLANMLFCPPGSHILEIADPDYPSPDFYALANSLNHYYWLLVAQPASESHPGARNLVADPLMIRDALRKVEINLSTDDHVRH